jgi:2,4-dienoyl-CoA reductase-like NADH-dependent reductase (Old Yellow Enzyme family)
MLGRIAAFVGKQGALAGVQLAHAGKKASTRRPWDGGGVIAESDGGWRPLEPGNLDEAGIGEIIRAFGAAARRAREAGFSVIEIHSAHGYLLHEFLSPIVNHRDDRWGGSFDNRTRIVREVVAAVRAEWPERLPLFVRISATDYLEGGWDLEQSFALAGVLAKEGVDLIDCSSGGIPGARIPVAPGYQVPFAERIRSAGVLSGAVGMITEPTQAEEIIARGRADVVLLARELLRDPHWPLRASSACSAPTSRGRSSTSAPNDPMIRSQAWGRSDAIPTREPPSQRRCRLRRAARRVSTPCLPISSRSCPRSRTRPATCCRAAISWSNRSATGRWARCSSPTT